MADSDISEYTYERTLIMEQRNEMLKEMKVSDKRAKKMVSHSTYIVSLYPLHRVIHQPGDMALDDFDSVVT